MQETFFWAQNLLFVSFTFFFMRFLLSNHIRYIYQVSCNNWAPLTRIKFLADPLFACFQSNIWRRYNECWNVFITYKNTVNSRTRLHKKWNPKFCKIFFYWSIFQEFLFFSELVLSKWCHNYFKRGLLYDLVGFCARTVFPSTNQGTLHERWSPSIKLTTMINDRCCHSRKPPIKADQW